MPEEGQPNVAFCVSYFHLLSREEKLYLLADDRTENTMSQREVGIISNADNKPEDNIEEKKTSQPGYFGWI